MAKYKKSMVRDAITDFESSDKLYTEYIKMFTTISFVTRQGNGLTWAEVEQEVKETLTSMYG